MSDEHPWRVASRDPNLSENARRMADYFLKMSLGHRVKKGPLEQVLGITIIERAQARNELRDAGYMFQEEPR